MTLVNVIPHIAAFLLTIYFHWLLIPVASRIGLTDKPSARKDHTSEVPLVGGIAMFFGLLFPMFVIELPNGGIKPMLLGLIILLLTGVLDDLRDLWPRTKFVMQLVAAIIMTSWAGVYVSDLGTLLGDEVLHLNRWAIPFTIICVVGIINALNMMDGVDGLAGTQALISFLFLFFLASSAGIGAWAGITMLYVSVVAGFLLYNLRWPGRQIAFVFMGDVGSMILGFGLAWFLVLFSQGEERAYRPVLALWIFAVPLFDMFGIMLRRILKGQSPLRPDRGHLHHILQGFGLGVNHTVGLLAVASVSFAGVGVALEQLMIPAWIMFYGYLGLFAIYVAVLIAVPAVDKEIEKVE